MTDLSLAVRVTAVLVFLFAACSEQVTVGVVGDDAAQTKQDAASEGPFDAGPAEPTDAGGTTTRPRDASMVGCEVSASISVCDPIRNTGCSRTLSMQCDVDLLAATLSGQCVFSVSPADSGLCLNIPPTESCPPGQTCIDGNQCHTVCLCDADCPANECCRMPLGNRGFKTCVSC